MKVLNKPPPPQALAQPQFPCVSKARISEYGARTGVHLPLGDLCISASSAVALNQRDKRNSRFVIMEPERR